MSSRNYKPWFDQKQIDRWLASKPGLFERPTSRGCWGAATRAFLKHETRLQKYFVDMVRAAGFDVRKTTLGGWILDKAIQE